MTDEKSGVELGRDSSALALSQAPNTVTITIARARPIRDWAGRINRMCLRIALLYRASAHTLKRRFLTGCGKTMLARENFDGPHVCLRRAQSSGTTAEHSRRVHEKARLPTRPNQAIILPARPESAKTDSSPWDTPCPNQARPQRVKGRRRTHWGARCDE